MYDYDRKEGRKPRKFHITVFKLHNFCVTKEAESTRKSKEELCAILIRIFSNDGLEFRMQLNRKMAIA
jgi:hypothetical protein